MGDWFQDTALSGSMLLAVPVALVAGRIATDADTSGFAATASLTDLAGSGEAAMADPARWLDEAGALLAREFADR